VSDPSSSVISEESLFDSLPVGSEMNVIDVMLMSDKFIFINGELLNS